jgi:hypothetical protein
MAKAGIVITVPAAIAICLFLLAVDYFGLF